MNNTRRTSSSYLYALLAAFFPLFLTAQSITNQTTNATFNDLQAAIDAATAGDVLVADAGTYSGANLTVNKNLTIRGANSSIDPNTGPRVAESIIDNRTLSLSGNNVIVIDGFRVAMVADRNGINIGSSTQATIRNCIIERNAATAGGGARGILLSAGHGNSTISNNRIFGDASNNLFSGHLSWNSGMYVNGTSASTLNITSNYFGQTRTAINFDDFNNGTTLSGNTITDNGSHLSFGGSTAPAGNFVLGANAFEPSRSAFINLSNVDPAFRLNITSSTYNGAAFDSYSLNDLAIVEAQMFHRGRSNRNGLVTYVAGNQYVISLNPSIQAAIDLAASDETVNIIDFTVLNPSATPYAERLNITRPLKLIGQSQTGAVIDGSTLGAGGPGINVAANVINVEISQLTVRNFAITGSNDNAGITGLRGNNGLVIRNVTLADNLGGHGFYANGPVNGITLDGVTASGHNRPGSIKRGIVIWNGLKENITVTNCTVFNNNCCGIELQDGTASGVNISNNNVYDNGDNGIAAIGLTGSAINLISNNTVTNCGRFGIEIKNPDGSAGGVQINNNNVSLTMAIGDQRDLAGIAVFRRDADSDNVNIPTGTTVNGNTVSGYRQTSDSDGFGIVIEGTDHDVLNNQLTNNDVGIQLQSGHTPYADNTNGITNGNQANLDDDYFGRGNSPLTCSVNVMNNTFSGNGIERRDVLDNDNSFAEVANVTTEETFCTIQAAIDAASPGDTIRIPAGDYSEDIVTTNKEISIEIGEL